MVTPMLDTPFRTLSDSWWLGVEYPYCSEPRSFPADRLVSVCRPGDTLSSLLGRMDCILCKSRRIRA